MVTRLDLERAEMEAKIRALEEEIQKREGAEHAALRWKRIAIRYQETIVSLETQKARLQAEAEAWKARYYEFIRTENRD